MVPKVVREPHFGFLSRQIAFILTKMFSQIHRRVTKVLFGTLFSIARYVTVYTRKLRKDWWTNISCQFWTHAQSSRSTAGTIVTIPNLWDVTKLFYRKMQFLVPTFFAPVTRVDIGTVLVFERGVIFISNAPITAYHSITRVWIHFLFAFGIKAFL